MTAVEHNMIFITAQKIWGTLQCTVASSTLRCTVVGPQSAKQNKSTPAGFELRTFYLDACNPARYPNDPSHPKARLQEKSCLPKNIKSNVQWSTAQWRNGSRVGDETYWRQWRDLLVRSHHLCCQKHLTWLWVTCVNIHLSNETILSRAKRAKLLEPGQRPFWILIGGCTQYN